MSQLWWWLFAPGSATYFVVRVVRHPGFGISVLLLLLISGCFVLTRPEQSGKAVHDLFSDSGSATTPPVATTTTSASDSVTGKPLPAWQCPDGYACFWSGPDGTGSRCTWDLDDPDWRAGRVVCSWSETDDVRSVINNGPDAVSYFRQANFRGRLDCVEPGQQVNLRAAIVIRSHRWGYGGCAGAS